MVVCSVPCYFNVDFLLLMLNECFAFALFTLQQPLIDVLFEDKCFGCQRQPNAERKILPKIKSKGEMQTFKDYNLKMVRKENKKNISKNHFQLMNFQLKWDTQNKKEPFMGLRAQDVPGSDFKLLIF